MKTLTVHQYWADAIFDHDKDIENRTWNTKYRGELLIHAGKSKTSLSDSEQAIVKAMGTPSQSPILGAIIGKVEIIDCVQNHPSQWAIAGHYHWILSNPKRCEPYYIKGGLSLWDFDETLLKFNNSIKPKLVQLSLFY
jgi:hypothetical protein